jgi:hypothetical protein
MKFRVRPLTSSGGPQRPLDLFFDLEKEKAIGHPPDQEKEHQEGERHEEESAEVPALRRAEGEVPHVRLLRGGRVFLEWKVRISELRARRKRQRRKRSKYDPEALRTIVLLRFQPPMIAL